MTLKTGKHIVTNNKSQGSAQWHAQNVPLIYFVINSMMIQWIKKHKNTHSYYSLGSQYYYSRHSHTTFSSCSYNTIPPKHLTICRVCTVGLPEFALNTTTTLVSVQSAYFLQSIHVKCCLAPKVCRGTNICYTRVPPQQLSDVSHCCQWVEALPTGTFHRSDWPSCHQSPMSVHWRITT